MRKQNLNYKIEIKYFGTQYRESVFLKPLIWTGWRGDVCAGWVVRVVVRVVVGCVEGRRTADWKPHKHPAV